MGVNLRPKILSKKVAEGGHVERDLDMQMQEELQKKKERRKILMTLLPSRIFNSLKTIKHTPMTLFFQLWSSFAHPALAQLESPIFVNPFRFQDWNLDAKFDSFLILTLYK